MKKGLIIVFSFILMIGLTGMFIHKKMITERDPVIENNNNVNDNEIDISLEEYHIDLEEANEIANYLYGREGTFVEVVEENDRFVINIRNEISLNIIQTFYMDKETGSISEKSHEVVDSFQ